MWQFRQGVLRDKETSLPRVGSVGSSRRSGLGVIISDHSAAAPLQRRMTWTRRSRGEVLESRVRGTLVRPVFHLLSSLFYGSSFFISTPASVLWFVCS
ncbi:hypothetical protein ACSS6W_009446 [Trichoderma asperelloides]